MVSRRWARAVGECAVDAGNGLRPASRNRQEVQVDSQAPRMKEGPMIGPLKLNPWGYLGFLGSLGCLGFLRYLPGCETFGKLHALFFLFWLFGLFFAPNRPRQDRRSLS